MTTDAELEVLRAAAACPGCQGRADDTSCICGGTGRASSAVIWLTEQVRCLLIEKRARLKRTTLKKKVRRKKRGLKLSPIPTDTPGILFTQEDFLRSVADRAITDWDGFGYLCTATHTAKKLVRVKRLRKQNTPLPAPYTHVLWFNR